MEEEYTGPERRKEERRHDHCALHNMLWNHHDKETADHRKTVCGKIRSLADDIKCMTPKWIFTLCISASFIFSIIIFGWLATQIKQNQDDIKGQLSVIHQRISATDQGRELIKDALRDEMAEVKNAVNAMGYRLGQVEHRINQLGNERK